MGAPTAEGDASAVEGFEEAAASSMGASTAEGDASTVKGFGEAAGSRELDGSVDG